MIRIHNSMTGEKQELQPIKPGHIGMYVCGMTVYDFLHIGHARMNTVFDIVNRYLRHRGYQVTYVRNITDIDDKIIKRAAQNGETIGALTERFINANSEDYARLGILRPDYEPRATQYVSNMIAMIATLIDKGYAYVAADGDVMYAVAKFAGYGRLSGKNLADLRAGARIEVDELKRDPLDFVLWKHAKPGEPSWESPWGPGRPGWHIECSAMSAALLGTHFDIHGGGMDLKFPHHENEIAQSCAATGDRFVNLWIHNGFVNVDNEKMSKSLGNFFTVREVLKAAVRHPEVLRFLFLMSHYRQPINYSLEQLEQADAALRGIYTALRDVPVVPAAETEYTARFHEVMDDDLNTPEAIAILQKMTREINLAKDTGKERKAAALSAELRSLAGVLGILTLEPEQWFRLPKPVVKRDAAEGSSGTGAIEATGEGSPPSVSESPSGARVGGTGLDDDGIQRLVDARIAARKAKDFAESDRIRDQLAAVGVIVEDKPGGKSTWRRA